MRITRINNHWFCEDIRHDHRDHATMLNHPAMEGNRFPIIKTIQVVDWQTALMAVSYRQIGNGAQSEKRVERVISEVIQAAFSL